MNDTDLDVRAQRDDLEYPWPKPGQSLATVSQGSRFAACLEWARGKHYGYVEGYRRAADLVFKQVVSSGRSMDILVFPLAFLWRHAIELQLKTIVVEARKSLGMGIDYPKHHDLIAAWQAARQVIAGLQAGGSVELPTVDVIVRELNQIDPDSTGFRYYERRDGSPTLSSAPDYLDLHNMHKVLTGVAAFLDAVLAEIQYRSEDADVG